MRQRRNSQKIRVGDIYIGGDSPVSIQSMTTTDTRDIAATVKQIRRLERAGCQLIRVAVLNRQAAEAIAAIKRRITIPLIADIHFDYRLAIGAIRSGADKIRLNPGNIRRPEHLSAVLAAADVQQIPVRIGVNSGSVVRRPGNALVEDLVAAAVGYRDYFRGYGFDRIIFSLKTPDVATTVEAYRRIAPMTDAPLHLGVTAAGQGEAAVIKSSIGIGALLLDGIGDTLRVSLTDDPVREVEVAREILRGAQVRESGIEIISCPTCGRTRVDLISVVKQAAKKLKPLQRKFSQRKLRVAIMGCVVNGPGEAQDADIGIAWGGSSGLLFRHGRKIKHVKREELLDVLFAEVADEVV
ncbi:MAG: flavodoxin-dependent (E)-4-hydroxy-3-methylbut-2-enyl-diphosphate synthase [Candidatus Omnitrophica bacterium]|nr:flavodoxin-dependent (E)-4-hydroxy-3-methylbut-2-enyl-diphosphate synthase [Candidatus Omnitrophota bacterium]